MPHTSMTILLTWGHIFAEPLFQDDVVVIAAPAGGPTRLHISHPHPHLPALHLQWHLGQALSPCLLTHYDWLLSICTRGWNIGRCHGILPDRWILCTQNDGHRSDRHSIHTLSICIEASSPKWSWWFWGYRWKRMCHNLFQIQTPSHPLLTNGFNHKGKGKFDSLINIFRSVKGGRQVRWDDRTGSWWLWDMWQWEGNIDASGNVFCMLAALVGSFLHSSILNHEVNLPLLCKAPSLMDVDGVLLVTTGRARCFPNINSGLDEPEDEVDGESWKVLLSICNGNSSSTSMTCLNPSPLFPAFACLCWSPPRSVPLCTLNLFSTCASGFGDSCNLCLIALVIPPSVG